MKRSALLVILLLTACASVSEKPGYDKTKMAEGYFMKGLSFMQQKNFELASVEFNRSIQTDSDYKQSYYMLGVISDQRGQYDQAVEYFKEALDRDSDYAEAFNALGVTYSKQQKWKDALKAYKKALENRLYPTPHIVYLNIGRLYRDQKEYDKAVEAYTEAKRHANQDFILYELGSTLLDAGRVKEAIQAFREGVAMSPQNASLRLSLGVALVKDGNKKGALEEFKKAGELAPGSTVAIQAKDYIQTLR